MRVCDTMCWVWVLGRREELVGGGLNVVAFLRFYFLFLLTSTQIDPNTGVSLFESADIIEYLRENYGPSK